MSPTRNELGDPGDCFPRVSGDEPYDSQPRADAKAFSPRERG